MNIAIIGADGFIGRHISNHLKKNKFKILNITRKKSNLENSYIIGDINTETNWKKIMKNVDTVIFCAGYSEVNSVKFKNIENLYEINTYSISNFIDQSLSMGISRIIFFSSFKVFDFIEHKKINNNEYAHSKYLAENIIIEKSKVYNNSLIVLRIPPVYGKYMKGSIKKLIKLVKFRIPLPVKDFKNKKSLLSIDNLLDLIELMCENKEKKYEKVIYNISDNEVYSIETIVKKISKTLERKNLVFYFPNSILKFFLFFLGMKNLYNSAFKNLYKDCSNDMENLNWYPKNKFEDQIKKIIND
tara:strand:- start:106 stop:1008 length:903 start_codon:yes stop_codon:yes gene_type:complete